jgi:hypothetical protein
MRAARGRDGSEIAGRGGDLADRVRQKLLIWISAEDLVT